MHSKNIVIFIKNHFLLPFGQHAINSCTILIKDNLIMSAVIGFITLSGPRGLGEVEMKLVRLRRSPDEGELDFPHSLS